MRGGDFLTPETASAVSGDWNSYRTAYYGSGSSSDPYIIDSEEKLAQLSYSSSQGVLTGYYKMTSNLDMGAHYFNPISPGGNFQGTFLGNGCIIYNLNVNYNGYSGLFDHVIDAKVSGVGLINPKIVNIYEGGYTGGIVGYANNCSISSCFVREGVISSSKGNSAGGICGYSIGTTTISDCFVQNVEFSVLASYQKTEQVYSNATVLAIYPFFPGPFQDVFSILHLTNVNYDLNDVYSDTLIAGIIAGYEGNLKIYRCYSKFSTSPKAKSEFTYRSSNNGYTLFPKSLVTGVGQSIPVDTVMDTGTGVILYENMYTTKELTTKQSTSTSSFYTYKYAYGIAPNCSSYSSCYFYSPSYSNGVGTSYSINSLKNLNLGSAWGISPYINDGYPHLKIFYWQDNV